MSERDLDKSILLKYSVGDCRLFKNDNGAAQLKDGTWITYGLGAGSSDIIGARSIIITQEMVGKKIAVAVTIEDKMRGKNPTTLQKNFLRIAKRLGCIQGVARSVEDAQNIFDNWLKEIQSP